MMRSIAVFVYLLFLGVHAPLLGNTIELSTEAQFNLADSIYSIQPDSSFVYYEQLNDKCWEENDTLGQIKCLQRMGFICYQQLSLAEALNYVTDALQLSESIKSNTNTATSLSRLGEIYLKLGQVKEAESYINDSHQIILKCFNNDEVDHKTLFNSYTNLAELSKRTKQFELAISYVDTCLSIAQSNNYNYKQTTRINRLKANTFSALGKYDQALEILLPMEKHYNTIASSNSSKSYYYNNAILVNAQLGGIYSKQEQLDTALNYFFKSLDLIEQLDKKKDYKPFILTEISKIYSQQKQYKKAYTYRAEAHTYTQKNLSVSSERSREVLKIRNSYIDKLNAKEKELLASKLMLANKAKANLRLRVLLLIVLVTTTTFALLVWNKKIKNRLKNEKKLIQEKAAEQDKLAQMELRYKNRELTSYSLQLMERDELLDRFTNYIEKEKSREAKSLKFDRRQLACNLWEEFEKRFVSIHQGFYKRLKDRCPELTSNDLKICALVKLNLKGKEIARLLVMTEKSVHSARYRIRKKLKLSPNASLEDFLNEV